MPAELPATRLPGAIPTLNATGYMLEALDEYAEAFIGAAAAGSGESLDIGCAYGVATLAALARECARVGFAVDRAAYFGMQRLGDESCGREHAGCVAVKDRGRA